MSYDQARLLLRHMPNPCTWLCHCVCKYMVGNTALCWQMFEKWKSEVDEKLKDEKRKKLRQERRAEENKKDESTRKREDAKSAYQMWCMFITLYCFDITTLGKVLTHMSRSTM